MRQRIFMMIQLHLSHTLVECETKVLIADWQLQATIQCRLLGQRKIVILLSGHLDGDTQLLNLGTASFTHIKAARSKCLSLQIKKTFLFEYPVNAINLTIFFTYKLFWFEILEYYAETR